jgi:hypothetical protein
MSRTDPSPSDLVAPPPRHGWQELILPTAGRHPARKGSLRRPRCSDRLPSEGIRRFRRSEEPHCAPSQQASAGDSSCHRRWFLRERGGRGRGGEREREREREEGGGMTGGRETGWFGPFGCSAACFCGGSSCNLFQVS